MIDPSSRRDDLTAWGSDAWRAGPGNLACGFAEQEALVKSGGSDEGTLHHSAQAASPAQAAAPAVARSALAPRALGFMSVWTRRRAADPRSAQALLSCGGIRSRAADGQQALTMVEQEAPN